MSTEWRTKTDRSKELYEEALKYTPEGVPSHAQGAWTPLMITKGKGSKMYDADGNSYIDHMLGAGPLILGHANPKLIETVKRQMDKGTHYWASHDLYVEAAKKVVGIVPSVDKVCFCSSGTEAVLQTIRIARAYTGRDKILKFEGQYHGWLDYVAISGYATPPSVVGPENRPNKIPFSAGIPDKAIEDILLAKWNDVELLEKAIKEHKHELAAVITAPIIACMGVVMPKKGYLEAMRELTEENDILLIFDEVVTGFRISLGGAQEYFGITPDLTSMAKALGGGFPLAAVGGKAEIMDVVGAGGVLHAGTMNANPLCLSASKATLEELEAGGLKHINEIGDKILKGAKDAIEDVGVDALVQGVPSLFSIPFTKEEHVWDFRDFLFRVDQAKIAEFNREMIDEGVWLWPGPACHWFTSTQHTHEDAEKAIEAVGNALARVK